jgi:hypothetical protein
VEAWALRSLPSRRQELGGAWTIRFGPLGASDVSVALTAFVH